ncbi:MAG TPA: serine protease [Bryobacteraceae bacterium]
MKAVTATVRIVNRTDRSEGTGVIVGQEKGAVYILTAAHVVARADRLEISTFSRDSYPRPLTSYEKTEVVAQTRDIRDLALVRVPTEDRAPATMPFCPLRQLPAAGGFESLSVGCGASKAPISLLENVQKEKRIRRPPGRDTALFWETAIGQPAGRSGGPLINKRGELIGLASGSSEGKGYYCHGAEIHAWLKGGKFAFLVTEQEKKEKE